MADAVVSHVIQSLDYLQRFMHVILRTKKFQIRTLRTEARRLVRLAEVFSSSNDRSDRAHSLIHMMYKLYVDTQYLEEESRIKQAILRRVPKYMLGESTTMYIHNSTLEILEEVVDASEEVEILEKISLFEAELEKFCKNMPEILEETDLRELDFLSLRFMAILRKHFEEYKFSHFLDNLESLEQENPMWLKKYTDEMNQDFSNFHPTMMAKLEFFFAASAKLKEETTFIYKEAMKIKGLCQDLRWLRVFLWNFANPCKNHELAKHLLKCISGVLCSADISIEESMLDMQLKMNTWRTNITIEECTAEVLDQIFNKSKGIMCSLLPTLEAIEFLKVKVKIICDEAQGIQNLQSLSTSEEVSKPPLPSEDIVVGLDDISKDILYRLVMGQPELEILPITGMGGIGKTTLARKLFDLSAQLNFYPHVWITVSQNYKVRDLLLDLLRFVAEPIDRIYEKNDQDLVEYLHRSLKGRKYLIVMDDIWSINVWDDVKRLFPDDNVGSLIILTTRLTNVAANVNPKIPPYHMNLLNADESWQLLKEIVFGKERCPPKLVDCGKQIVKKCQGLPLAIVVLAGHLSRIKRTFECWKDVADKVSLLVETDPQNCLEILALSYNFLPYHLKACFLYMCAFPEDWEIEVLKLINLWVAEGFLDQKSSNSLEGVGHEFLEDLVDRSLVLVGKRSYDGKIKTCRIHVLLRELCLREAKKEKFIHVINHDSEGFPSNLNDEHRLSFHLESDGDVYLVPSLSFIRSFLCFSIGSGFSPDIFLCHLHFKLLSVLDIGFLHFDHFPYQILELVLLKYLELTVSHDILAPLMKLKNLHTLVIHGHWQTSSLSMSIWDMPWLRHLQTSAVFSVWVPCVLTQSFPCPFTPKFLHTLSTVQISNCNEEVFRVMPGLKKLGICETEEDFYSCHPSEFLRHLVYLKHLEILKCSFYIQNRAKRSHLISCGFPSSIRQLTLSGSCLPWEDTIFIARLPFLEVLKLKNYAFRGREWTPVEGGFCHLKHLLVDKTDLEVWEVPESPFPRLQRLILRSCELLVEIPFSVGEIPTLQLIELHHCSKTAEIAAEEIGSQFDAIKVHIRSNHFMENHQ